MGTMVAIKEKVHVRIDASRDALLTDFGKAVLQDRYLLPGESYQDLFARVACYYADDGDHAQRLYDYISRLWFMPATPVLSNGGTSRGLPISCFLNEANDSLEGIVDLWNENVWLAARALWIRILTARIETGEPYIVFIDHVNRALPEHQKLAGLRVKTSNLCSEITLPTGEDLYGKQRTALFIIAESGNL